jgi:hypothetical protein
MAGYENTSVHLRVYIIACATVERARYYVDFGTGFTALQNRRQSQ